MEHVMSSKQTKKYKILYRVCTAIIALFELSGAFFINSQMAIDGMHHLGLPDWFRWEVSIGHVIGGILLIIPVRPMIKEWVYVAFGIDFISAFIAYLSIDGWVPATFSPLILLVVLIVSYISYHKIATRSKSVAIA